MTGVSELVLEVSDLVAAERFYAGTLGLPVVARRPWREAVWVMAGDRTRIGLWRPQVGTAGGRGGSHVHFALNLEDGYFDAAVAALRSEGLPVTVEQHRRGSRSAYVDDPDGNCVELWTRDVSQHVRRIRLPAQLPEEARSPEHFDSTADRWDSSYEERSLRAHRRLARMETTLRLVGDGPGSLLEIGVGSGRLLAAFAARGWTVSGIDAAPRMIDLARARIPLPIERLTVGRAEALPFDAGAFDVAAAIGVLEYTDMEASLAEIARVLRSGGRAVIGFRRSLAPATVWQRGVVFPIVRGAKSVASFGRPLPPRRRSPLRSDQISGLLTAFGFSMERVEHVACGVLPDPFERLLPTLAYRAARTAEGSARLRRVFGTQLVVLGRKR